MHFLLVCIFLKPFPVIHIKNAVMHGPPAALAEIESVFIIDTDFPVVGVGNNERSVLLHHR